MSTNEHKRKFILHFELITVVNAYILYGMAVLIDTDVKYSGTQIYYNEACFDKHKHLILHNTINNIY